MNSVQDDINYSTSIIFTSYGKVLVFGNLGTSDDYLYLVFRGRKRVTLPSDFLVASKSWITHFAALFRLDGATHRRIKIILQVPISHRSLFQCRVC